MVIIFAITIFIYLLFSIKITFWQTISRCGFKSETPVFYITNPLLFKLLSLILFLISILFAYLQHTISLWIAIFIPVIFFLISSIVGRNLGIKKLRIILKELADNSDGILEKQDIGNLLNLNNLELLNHFVKKL